MNYQFKHPLRGEIGVPENELRDPYLFEDIDHKTYIFYTDAGGIRDRVRAA